jgi:hypothetical protein
MPVFRIKAEVVVTYEYEVIADTIEDAIASVEDGDEDDCFEIDGTLPTVVAYTIPGQMGWNNVENS